MLDAHSFDKPYSHLEEDSRLPLGDSILASWIRSICQTVRGYGLDPGELMVKAGLDVAMLTVPDARYPAMNVRRFWEIIVAATRDDLGGMRCGHEMQVATLHGLGLAIVTSHSLAQVLELMKKLKAQYQTAMVMITHDLGIVAEICDYVAIMYAGEVVEYGTREHIFNSTAHPYTKGLFACIPDIFTEQNELIPINGLTPDPTDLPQGCRFNPRCPYATERCRQEHPENVEIEPGHFVACHLINGGGNENA